MMKLNKYEKGLLTYKEIRYVCTNYQLVNGCDEQCPVLLSGDCPQIVGAIEECIVPDDERERILALYES